MIPEDDFGDYRSPWDLSGTPMPGESTNVWHVVRLDVESPLPIYMNKAIEREIAKMVNISGAVAGNPCGLGPATTRCHLNVGMNWKVIELTKATVRR